LLNANGHGAVIRARMPGNERNLARYANGERLDAAIAEDGGALSRLNAANIDTNEYRTTSALTGSARGFDPSRQSPWGPVFFVRRA
jgi:hypothetical protein